MSKERDRDSECAQGKKSRKSFDSIPITTARTTSKAEKNDEKKAYGKPNRKKIIRKIQENRKVNSK